MRSKPSLGVCWSNKVVQMVKRQTRGDKQGKARSVWICLRLLTPAQVIGAGYLQVPQIHIMELQQI
jgi:hypothetical protein